MSMTPEIAVLFYDLCNQNPAIRSLLRVCKADGFSVKNAEAFGKFLWDVYYELENRTSCLELIDTDFAETSDSLDHEKEFEANFGRRIGDGIRTDKDEINSILSAAGASPGAFVEKRKDDGKDDEDEIPF